MEKYLLDTDTCVFFLHEKFNLFEKVTSIGFDNCFVSEITLAELFFGAYNGNDPTTDRNDSTHIEGNFGIIPIYRSLELYGKEKARLRKSGMIIPELDLLIATTALHHNMTLVTNNTRHMQRIDGIRLENWTKAEDNAFIK